MILNLTLFFLAFLSMEFVAWFTHKYVMHGFLWILHEDHHLRNHKHLEWNDLFAFIFAIPSVILIVSGLPGFTISFYLGAGIAFYGFCYFLFHDALVHGRLKICPTVNMAGWSRLAR